MGEGAYEGDAVEVVGEGELGPVSEPEESLHGERQPLGAMLAGDRSLPRDAAVCQVDCPGTCIATVALSSAAAAALIATAGPSLTGDGARTVERR